MEIDFSEEENEEEVGGFGKKKMGLHQEYKPKQQGVVHPFINMHHYFHQVGTIADPDLIKQWKLKN
jgi:hypothetical protein